MLQVNTQGIVLKRTDYNEADRIITFLTPDQGKITVLARGVRKTKSKLAGGIELFSISDITYINGRGEVHTLVSTRLVKHFGKIVTDLNRTNLGYDFIKLLDRSTEEHPEPEYFELLAHGFEALDDKNVNIDLIEVWFKAQLLRMAGHSPNLKTDEHDEKLDEKDKYLFNFETMNFNKDGVHNNSFDASSIKFLRLLFSGNLPGVLNKIKSVEVLSAQARPLVNSMMQTYIQI